MYRQKENSARKFLHLITSFLLWRDRFFGLNQIWQFHILSFARLGLLAGGTSYHREHTPTRERTFVKRNSDVESVYNSECGATEIQFSLVFSLANLEF